MQWLADRFFLSNGGWIDAASGVPVRMLIEDASEVDALDWDEQCARLARARHPLLNPLIDYGPAPDGQRFEAYGITGEAPAAAAIGERSLMHVTAFLRAAGIAAGAGRCRVALRPVVAAAGGAAGRPIGITLQPRRALDGVREALAIASPAPAVIRVSGPARAGLRTLKTFVARAARLNGFAPVCASLLARVEFEPVPDRHLCILDDLGAGHRCSREMATRLMELSRKDARRHVIVSFERQRSGQAAIPLEPLSVRSLVGMVFVSETDGPSEEELFVAARAAAGRPGDYLAHLQGPGLFPARHSSVSVHETSPAYTPEPEIGTRPSPPARRGISCASRSVARAQALAARGRHAAAMRALLRGGRVLAGAGHVEASGECVLAAAHLALERGRSAEAAALFDDARRQCGAGLVGFRAAAGLGEAWTSDGRLTEAEVMLRGTLAAADTVGDKCGAAAVTAALMKALYYQGRYGDALAILGSREWSDGSQESAVLLSVVARCHASLGRIAPALRLARAAVAAADGHDHPAILDRAVLALAEVLALAGDLGGMRGELNRANSVARRSHLPLMVLEAHLIECDHLEPGAGTLKIAGVLHTWRRRNSALPPVLRERLERVLARLPAASSTASPRRTPGIETDARREGADALEHLLQEGQRAPDDAAAVAAVCAAVMRRLQATTVLVQAAQDRRVLAVEGRAWVAHSTVIAQSLATGMPCATEAGCEPREAAAPVRYGGDIVAIIAARWTAGAEVDGYGAAAVLHAAALAVAAPVRAVLDRAVPPAPPGAWGDLLGDSAAATALRDSVLRAARAPFPVLIEGESGSGKELVARAIHRLGARRDRRFCAINCAALTDDLVEAELFGHARGAFTGAAMERAGLFEEADGGTLFLDEIGELSPRAQAKLLRVLQEGEVRRVGENFPRRVDPRIVAATNRQLEQEAAAGRFRADLRFRLDVIRITVPPLRERPGDIPLLAAQFWNEASTRVGSRATLSGDALAALARHDWPGNVRELQNVVAWMAVHSPPRGRIGPSSLPAHVAGATSPGAGSIEAARDEFERRFIRAALAGANGQRARAAQALGITRQGLAKMMRRLRIEVSS
jgi:DNA-binding NtrC family response regulator